MPLSITDNKHFIHFLSIMDTKYTAVSCRTITSRLDTMVSERQSKLISAIATAENLSVTMDIWPDRRIRGYGVTAHWMNTAADAIMLKSHLLACNRFKGSHSRERICEEFEQICDQYKIKQKMAAEADDDDAELCNALPVDEEERLSVTLTSKSQHRLQYFARTLESVVGDGRKETRAVSSALAKVCGSVHCSTQVTFESNLMLQIKFLSVLLHQ